MTSPATGPPPPAPDGTVTFDQLTELLAAHTGLPTLDDEATWPAPLAPSS